jgi:serine/threonine protein kinase
MTDDSLLAKLSEEYIAGIRNGKAPELEEYANQYPHLAQRIRDLFPTLMMLEGVADTEEPTDRSATSMFSPGATFGRYRAEREIGRGGMGIVYLAEDLSLTRKVALKFLSNMFTGDLQRMARFEREAKLLASLNHPNIATIYGIEQAEDKRFLVLEFTEGETLADQLKHGPIPVEEALKLALQIAEGLEAAHEKGVIHRDLKPANIKVTPEGKVKVLDFGLAKAFAGEQAGPNLSKSPALNNSATQQGVILGTAAYMSPEQARGKVVDKRTDIWAFGCVLYQMLTGRQIWTGETVTDIIAAALTKDPDFSHLPSEIHPDIRKLLSRCLQKDAAERFRDAGDVRIEIRQILADHRGLLTQPISAPEPRTMLTTIFPWVTAAILLGAIIAGVAVWKLKSPEPRQVVRFQYELPEGQHFGNLTSPALAVSPDGKQFVYSTTNGLYLRSVDELTAKLIAGTEGSVEQPFFSPDGKWIGYFSASDPRLRKVSINGGAPVTLCGTAIPVGAWWGADNFIVYGQRPTGSLLRISSAQGGTPEVLIRSKSGVVFFHKFCLGGNRFCTPQKLHATNGGLWFSRSNQRSLRNYSQDIGLAIFQPDT